MTKAQTLAKEKEMENQQENYDADFQKDLSINKYKLDEECISHASRYAYYAEACAIAKTSVSEAKDKLELVEAERYEVIRADLENKGIKTTIPMLDRALITDEEVQKAKAELRDAETTLARLQVAVNAMDARRSELDNLVKLYVAGYYSVADGAGVKKSINENVASDIRRNLSKK